MSAAIPATSPSAPVLVLDEAALRRVLLVQAFEEADSEEALLRRSERERASERARASLPEGDRSPGPAELGRFAAERAATLLALLEERLPSTRRISSALALAPPAWLVLGPAFLVGLGTSAIGPAKRIHVLANPLLGLIAWNLAVFVLLPLLERRTARTGGWTWLGRAGERLARLRAGSLLSRRVTARGELATEAAARFVRSLARHEAPLLAARARRLLHVGAIALIAGALAGLYLRGLVLEYRATWESTFLDAAAAHGVLRVLLFPSVLLTGIPLPPIEDVRSPANGDAAPWIHLYAAATGIYVLVPRALLALRESVRARRLASAIPVAAEGGYLRRLASAHRGAGTSVLVLPYSYRPAPRASDRLGAFLHDVFGARARVRVAEPLEYGAEAEDVDGALHRGEAEASACHVLLFALAQTAEDEVHGRVAREIAEREAGGAVLCLVDASGYRERLGEGSLAARRLEEHRASWDRVLRGTGVALLHVDLGEEPSDELAARAGELVSAAREERTS